MKLTRIGLWLCLLALISGCTLVHLRQDNAFSKTYCLISGHVYADRQVQGPIIVLAYAPSGKPPAVAHSIVLYQPGSYELLVPGGTYRVFAFEDKNKNRILDPDELAGIALGDESDYTIVAPDGGWVDSMAIVLSRNQTVPYRLPADLPAQSTNGPFKWRSAQLGAVIDLNDHDFAAEQGVRGFWSPLEFFRDFGANIYFLEPYDEKKIPVLLVHGAAGSPQDWRYFIDHLDRSRYQPWIFYYPSGARLKSLSELLGMKIDELHRRYHFETLYVTAHSMGGHISRYMLVHQPSHQAYTKLFITISTPFGGESLAGVGVRNSPAVIPSWKDMTPGSDFIQTSFSKTMPPAIKYYLFFGHKGGGNPLRPNNDTTVTLESMLDPRAQAEAVKLLGFNEDHVGILNSADVFAKYRAILESADREVTAADRAIPKGKIRLHYMLEEASDCRPLWMTLLLVPEDQQKAALGLYPDPLQADQQMGPVAAGTYDIGLLAWGYQTSPARIQADVRPNSVTDVAVSLKPQGMIGGQIALGLNKEELYWGFFPSLRREKKVKSITLAGNGLTRKIIPREESLNDSISDILNRRDYFRKDFFIFFHLPKGQYELRVEATGCRPAVKTIAVDPKVIHAPLKIQIYPDTVGGLLTK